VGILYPQNAKFGDNDAVKEKIEEEPEAIPEEGDGEEESSSRYTMYKDDAFDDDVNMAQQNKPSSMGFTFFINGNISSLKINVKYAKYSVADDKDIVVPCPYDDLYIPDCLSGYVAFDKENKTLKKLQPIKWNELNDLFEHNAIEDLELLNTIANLNKIFQSKRAYRRCPFNEDFVLNFENNIAMVDLQNTKGYITAVKHRITDSVYSITVMLVNSEKIGRGHIFQPQIRVKSTENESTPTNSIQFKSYSNLTIIIIIFLLLRHLMMRKNLLIYYIVKSSFMARDTVFPLIGI